MGVPCVFLPFLLAIEGTWEIDSVISLSRSVIAVCMCAIEMWVVCFTTDFTDTGPYLLLLVSRRFTSSSSSLGRGGVCSWFVLVCVF